MIDPKTLHIGAHVMVNGVRARVIRIDEPKDEHEIPHCTLLRFKAFIDGKWRDCGCSADADKVEPIPITEELLNELGFHKSIMCGEWIAYAKGIDAITIRVAFQGAVCKCAEVRDNDNKEMMFGWSCPCKYLHELESFVHLTAKTELIKE